MLKSGYIVLFMLLMLFGSCETKLTRFYIDYNTEVGLPVENTSMISLQTSEMKTNCRVRFERNDTKRSKVKNIYLKRLTFSTDTDSTVLNLLDLEDVFISSPDYPEQEIVFSRPEVSVSGKKVTFNLMGSAQDIKTFINQDRFSMRFGLKNGTKLKQDVTIRVEIGLLVEGELIKTNLFHKILV